MVFNHHFSFLAIFNNRTALFSSICKEIWIEVVWWFFLSLHFLLKAWISNKVILWFCQCLVQWTFKSLIAFLTNELFRCSSAPWDGYFVPNVSKDKTTKLYEYWDNKSNEEGKYIPSDDQTVDSIPAIKIKELILVRSK